MNVKWARFIKSATRADQYPDWGLFEVAFVGRSNVGKSSLINALVQRHDLVRVSKTPGRTRLLNFFHIGLPDDREIGLVDLPGYGYAKVSASEKAAWSPMIEDYFASRNTLRALVLLMDLRHGMTTLDRQLFDGLGHFGIQPVLVFTKADKLSRNQQFSAHRRFARELGIPHQEILLFSSLDGTGRDALWRRILNLTLPPVDDPPAPPLDPEPPPHPDEEPAP